MQHITNQLNMGKQPVWSTIWIFFFLASILFGIDAQLIVQLIDALYTLQAQRVFTWWSVLEMKQF